LVKKSLKKELPLKRYERLKLQGLKCKMIGAAFEPILKTWSGLQFVKSSGALV
jgi:hypothetical protein